MSEMAFDALVYRKNRWKFGRNGYFEYLCRRLLILSYLKFDMEFPLEIEQMDCSPITFDNGYRVADLDLLSKWIAQLLMGNFMHITQIIAGLEGKSTILRNEAIDSLIAMIDVAEDNTKGIEKRDGWLFQMMSWIALNMNLHNSFSDKQIFMNAPHTAPAQHGLDGFALVLDNDKKIRYIILTEDKCTAQDRGKIQSQVLPEFEEIEKGLHDNRILSEVSSIIRAEDGGSLLLAIQDDIVKSQYWVYRIGVTRCAAHNDINGRKKLYKDYDSVIKGNIKRRDAASIYIEQLRPWMANLCKMVVKELESKKQ